MATEPRLDIYFDAGCAFCQWSRARVEPWDTHNRLHFLDCNDPEVAASAPYSREQLGLEMHVRGPDGAWSTGFAAWVCILRVLPGLAGRGGLLGMPPFRWLGPLAYAWVAHHRSLLPGIPSPCTRETCPSPARRDR
jgi:predicted DCC family thiol-disulfide oxidoreductase YuxK